MKKPRACGTCNLCCTALHIKEFDKPANVPCEHLSKTGKGCGIYESRPPVCRGFRCAWLTGNIPSEMRPDRTHIVVWGDPKGNMVVVEAARGALDRPANLALVKEILTREASIVHRFGQDPVLLGNPEKVRRVHLQMLPEDAEGVAELDAARP